MVPELSFQTVAHAESASTQLSPTQLSPTYLSPTYLSPTYLSPTQLSSTQLSPMPTSFCGATGALLTWHKFRMQSLQPSKSVGRGDAMSPPEVKLASRTSPIFKGGRWNPSRRLG